MVTAMGVFADWSQCNLNRISGTPQAMGASLPQQDVFRHSVLCQSSSAVGDTIQLSHTVGRREGFVMLVPFSIFMSTELQNKCIRNSY